MVARDGRAFVTRALAEAVSAVQEKFPEARYFEAARLIAVGEFPTPQSDRFVAVVTAGTSDLFVAEEAAITLEWLGTRVERVYDVGVAGVHRLLSKRELLWKASAVIAIAGMEGALATVVGGLVSCPDDCRADERGLRRELQRHRGAAGDVEFVRARRVGGQHRQRFWRGGLRAHDCEEYDANSVHRLCGRRERRYAAGRAGGCGRVRRRGPINSGGAALARLRGELRTRDARGAVGAAGECDHATA